MPRKKKRRNKIVEIGNGLATVKIYTVNRSNGYPHYTVAWKEGGRRRTRIFASMDEARMIAQQTSVRLTNGANAVDEVTKRDIELLRHCEQMGAKRSSSGPDLLERVSQAPAFRDADDRRISNAPFDGRSQARRHGLAGPISCAVG